MAIVDFTQQISKNAQTSLDGFKNIGTALNQLETDKINRSKQLFSDLDAVMNEVDDMQKENVSNSIQETQKKLANNIYKKKGKNGVKLNLTDLNSDDFNYARDMRSLKNLATNSRLNRKRFEDLRDSAKNDKYLSESDRVKTLASATSYLSSKEALESSPEQVQDSIKGIYDNYRDVAQEVVDGVFANSVSSSDSTYVNIDGSLYKDSTSFIEGLVTQDVRTGEYIFDEEKASSIVDSYSKNTPMTIDQKRAAVDRLRQKALSLNRNIVKSEDELKNDQATLDQKSANTKNTDASTALIYKRLELIDQQNVEEKQLVEAENAVIEEIQKGFDGSSEVAKDFLESIKLSTNIKDAFYVKNEEEYSDFLLRKAAGLGNKIKNKIVYTYTGEGGEPIETTDQEVAKAAYKKQWITLSKDPNNPVLVVDYQSDSRAPTLINLSDGGSYALLKRLISQNYNVSQKLEMYTGLFGKTNGDKVTSPGESPPQAVSDPLNILN